MGGERETVVPKSSKSGSEVKLDGGLRIHESGGEVHFHDDPKKLKCAVPVADWWKAWGKISCQPGKWEWIDSKHNTILSIETQVQSPNFDVTLALAPITLSAGFQKLDNFTKGK